MSTFLEWICETGKAPDEKVQALILSHLHSAPSFQEAAAEAKLLSPRDMVRALCLQATTGTDFRSACQTLGVWNDAMTTALKPYTFPSAQLLVDGGVFSAEQVEALVAEFRGQVGAAPQTAAGAASDWDFLTATTLAAARAVVQAPFDRAGTNRALFYSHSLRSLARLAGARDIEECATTFEAAACAALEYLSEAQLVADTGVILRQSYEALLTSLEGKCSPIR